ncbi:MAG: L-2-hydroxyglutarate oxidase [Ignavibacterium sp.]|nr:L-2-hydroxyglutarate oxidase [Ignavibacterium sp.]MCX7611866.1 L-2-hydroxyglutarate oxidase [Ignavibacterium sp.]MDW8374896.1 L-2-hydroxyglutarate oxidase [Ignavibacteriales bacterium]
MKNSKKIIFIGGGIVGLASAFKLLENTKIDLILLEKEDQVAKHQTGNNSGVIHSGIYYKPGSLKARNCAIGREMMYDFCYKHGIPHERCGKIILATNEKEIERLEMIEQRGIQNGLSDIKRLSKDEIKEYEPYANGLAAIYVPYTGIVDYVSVSKKLAELIIEMDGLIKLNSKVEKIIFHKNEIVVQTNNDEFSADYLVNCSGLHSDKIAELCGLKPEVKIIPFRGEYYKLKKDKEYLVKNLIYPVPDPQFPFLGVHFTRMIKGGVECGPNAVLAFKKEGYKKSDIDLVQIFNMLTFNGFWYMAKRYYKMGFEEFKRSFSKKLFVQSLQKLIPSIQEDDLIEGGAGVRAQALDRNGNLIDDFRIIQTNNMIHVLNAPSPAATASLSIGDTISKMILKNFDL